jgi:DNA-binding XRE family transcriptional regulator
MTIFRGSTDRRFDLRPNRDGAHRASATRRRCSCTIHKPCSRPSMRITDATGAADACAPVCTRGSWVRVVTSVTFQVRASREADGSCPGPRYAATPRAAHKVPGRSHGWRPARAARPCQPSQSRSVSYSATPPVRRGRSRHAVLVGACSPAGRSSPSAVPWAAEHSAVFHGFGGAQVDEPTIGERIRELRRGIYTQTDLAAAAGVSVDVIRKLEQGRRHTVSIGTLQHIAVRWTSISAGCWAPPVRFRPLVSPRRRQRRFVTY